MKKLRQRFGLLLLALGVTFFFQGVVEPGAVQRALATILVGATLMLALDAAESSRRLLVIAGSTVVAIVVSIVVATLAGEGTTVKGIAAIADGLMMILAPPAVVIGVLRNLRATGVVTIVTVGGVLCLYLLLGLFFSFVFIAVQNLGGDPFFANGAPATSAHATYFSFVTMTTTGYGDFTARNNLGHMLAATEALLGQIYLVTVVAAIVGRVVPRGRQIS